MPPDLLCGQRFSGHRDPGLLPVRQLRPQLLCGLRPHLFDDTKQLQDYLNSDIGKDLFNSVESMGISCLGSWTRSFRQVTNSKKPINSPLTWRGMVLRTPQQLPVC